MNLSSFRPCRLKGQASLLAALLLLLKLSCSVPALGSELLSGRVVSVDPSKGIVTIRDMESGKDRIISFEKQKNMDKIRPGSSIRMWVTSGRGDSLKMEHICGEHGYDMTGIKRRLRKAAGSKGRGRGHGHGRGHGR